MLTLIFFILLVIVFGRLAIIAFRATWGILKVLLTIVFFPLILIGMAISGMAILAIIIIVIVGVVSLLTSAG